MSAIAISEKSVSTWNYDVGSVYMIRETLLNVYFAIENPFGIKL